MRPRALDIPEVQTIRLNSFSDTVLHTVRSSLLRQRGNLHMCSSPHLHIHPCIHIYANTIHTCVRESEREREIILKDS